MKNLFVVRHAKSSWDNEDLSDFERPLNDRGKRDAPEMGRRLKERGVKPNLLYSSPAKRALSTAKRIAEVLGYPKGDITTDRRLYHAGDDTIFKVLGELKDKHDTVVIFGHNPGLTDFVNALMNERAYVDNVPTAGVVHFTLPITHWKDIAPGTGSLILFDYPKNIS